MNNKDEVSLKKGDLILERSTKPNCLKDYACFIVVWYNNDPKGLLLEKVFSSSDPQHAGRHRWVYYLNTFLADNHNHIYKSDIEYLLFHLFNKRIGNISFNGAGINLSGQRTNSIFTLIKRSK